MTNCVRFVLSIIACMSIVVGLSLSTDLKKGTDLDIAESAG